MKKRSLPALILALVLILTGYGAFSASAASGGVCYLDTEEDAVFRMLTTPPLYEVREGTMVSGVAELPVDVTESYRGQYGIPADADRGYAYQISLQELCWQDGTAVTAADLSRAMEATLETGWIAGATQFLEGWERESENIISLKEAGFSSVAQAQEAGYHRFYVNLETFWGLDTGWESATSRTKIRDYAMPSGLLERYVTAGYLYETYLAEGMDYDYLQPEFVGITAEPEERMTLEDVGLLEIGERELVLILQGPTTAGVVASRLAALTPVRPDGMALSYGPYQIVSREEDQITLERNPYWSGDTTSFPADTILCKHR